MAEKFLLEMKGSEQLKSCLHQKKQDQRTLTWQESMNIVIVLYKNAMLMLEKIYFKISFSAEVQLCSTVWEKECGKKFIY